jgi:hypothetical protein
MKRNNIDINSPCRHLLVVVQNCAAAAGRLPRVCKLCDRGLSFFVCFQFCDVSGCKLAAQEDFIGQIWAHVREIFLNFLKILAFFSVAILVFLVTNFRHFTKEKNILSFPSFFF